MSAPRRAAPPRGRSARRMGKVSAHRPFIRLDPRAPEALQTQIYAAIRQAILDGALPPGAPVLSSRALAAELGVSRTTTLLALEQLMAEGYLETRARSGTFVARDLPDDRPRARATPPRTRPRHPAISRRGALLASVPPSAVRIPGPPCAFRIGIPAVDLFPMRLWTQLVHRRVRALTVPQLDYSHAAGFQPLREAIADHVHAARGTRCDPDQIFIVGGAQRGLDLIFRLLLDPGDRAWLEEPGYFGARSALLGAGARVQPARVDAQGVDVSVVERDRRGARLIYVTPSNQFPLGVPMSLPRRYALLRWASAAHAWIVEDDYDSEFRYGTRPLPCLHGLDVDGRVIYVGSFSKTLFPALRLGFLIVPPDLRETLIAVRRSGDVHPPVLEQAALADLMHGGHYERHLRRMRAAYHERLQALEAAAVRCCGDALRLRPVLSGLHAVADVKADAERVFEEALARGVETMPLSAYCGVRAQAPNGLVLGFAPVRPEMAVLGMERLAAAIEAARRRRGRRAGTASDAPATARG